MRPDHPMLLGIDGVEPYHLADSSALYSEQSPPMLIASFLPAGGVMGITSYPGVGKTWLTLEIIRAVGTGLKFLGRFDVQQGGCLFVGSDSSVYDYARQWTRLTRHHELAYAPDEHDKSHPLFHATRFLLQSSFMFEDMDECRRLIATCRKFEWGEEELRNEGTADVEMARRRGIDVIVFDTLSRLTRANQNDNTEMEEVFRNIRWIAEATGAAIVLLHHNSKKSEFNDGADWRGAMSQIGALDSWVQLAAHRRDKNLVGVSFKKFRGITPEDFSYRMNVDDPSEASIGYSDEPVTTQQRLQSDPLAEALHEQVEATPGLTAPELRKLLWPKFECMPGWTDEKQFRKAIDNRLVAMSGRGRITKTNNEKGRPVYGPQVATT